MRARAGRLELQPGDPPEAAEAVRDLIRKATAIRPDARLYEEAVGVEAVAGPACRRVPLVGPESKLSRFEQHTLTWDRSGTRLLLHGKAVEVATGQVEALAPDGVPEYADPTGRWLATDTKHGVQLLDRTTGRSRTLLQPSARAFQLGFSPDGEHFTVVVRGKGEDRIEISPCAGDRPAVAVPIPKEGQLRIEFSRDGRRLAWHVQPSDSIQVVGTDTGAVVTTLALPTGTSVLNGLALSPDGSRVAWSKVGWAQVPRPRVVVQDVSTGSVVCHPDEIEDSVTTRKLEFTPDGRFLIGYVTGGFIVDGAMHHLDRVVVWDAGTGAPLVWIPGHGFASGVGPAGELAVVRLLGTAPDARPIIEVWRPDDVRARLEQAGLTAGRDLALSDSQVVDPYTLDRPLRFLYDWPAVAAYAAWLGVALAEFGFVRRGKPVPRWIVAGVVALGGVAVGGGVVHSLAVFYLPRWTLMVVGNLASRNAFIVLLGLLVGALAIRKYRSAL